jgi:hypothetical protein
MLSRTFWAVMTAAVLIWYSTVTIYVGIKGIKDIKQMLARLKPGQGAGEGTGETPKP